MNHIFVYKQLKNLYIEIDSITELCHKGFFNLFLNDYNIERENYIKLEKRISIFYHSFFDLLVKNNELIEKFNQSVLDEFLLLYKKINVSVFSSGNIDFNNFSTDVYKIVTSFKISIEKIITEYAFNQNVKTIIIENINDIYKLCSKHFVKNLFVFGSILTDKFNKKSDVDLLYEIDINKLNEANDNPDYIGNLLQFEESMAILLNRKIDLVPYIPIRNKYMRESINRNKRLLYAA